jgi:S-DNA-T family DNA segregation ATPase FtsK/SpoIIIE
VIPACSSTPAVAATVQNLFGVFGANFAGILVGLFGIGAFWIPFLCLLGSILFFGKNPGQAMLPLAAGGILLIVTTGSLLAFSNRTTICFSAAVLRGRHRRYSAQVFCRALFQPGRRVDHSDAGLADRLYHGDRVFRGGILPPLQDGQLRPFRPYRHRSDQVEGASPEKFQAAPDAQGREEKEEREDNDKDPGAQPGAGQTGAQAGRVRIHEERFGLLLPSVNFLDDPKARPQSTSEENLRMQSRLLEKKLEDFGVNGKVVAVTPGPVITTFEYEPAPGVKINRIVSLTDDLALALRAISIRIVAPIPGKAVIGVEIPNTDRETVRFKEMILSPSFEQAKSTLTLCLGKDIVGNPVSAGLEKMPHLLIAGATGTGKSVALNTMICSLLYKLTPDR